MSEEVCAELSGNVWKIVVTRGQDVSEGDTLMILESMKMEIPVIAEIDGSVSSIEVVEGQSVQEDDVLAILTTN